MNYINSKVEILFLSWNRKSFAQESLLQHLNNSKYPHILVIADNGSEDGMAEWLKSNESIWRQTYPHVNFKFRYYKKNYGKMRIMNHFFRLKDINTDYIGILLNDVLVADSWIKALVDVLDNFSDIGIVSEDDGRGWGQTVQKNGIVINEGDCFYFCDDSWLMRARIIDEMKNLDRQTSCGEQIKIIHSGYILDNMNGVSEPHYYADIRRLGYKTAVRTGLVRKNISSSKCNSVEDKKYCLIVKRFFIFNIHQYWKLTSGILTWMEDNEEHTFENEPEEEQLIQNFNDNFLKNIPTGQLDDNCTENDINLFSEDEFKKYGNKTW